MIYQKHLKTVYASLMLTKLLVNVCLPSKNTCTITENKDNYKALYMPGVCYIKF